MYTIAFIGPSGTGKSHRSVTIAKKTRADAIIDDGLLISKNKVLAGFSAKKEATKMAAVKRALFTKEEHIKSVKDAIKENNIKRILVLGTSLKMAERIANELEIGPIKEVIRIEDIATKKEMEDAVNMRTKEGKHVIPVPIFEIKHDFSGYFLNPLKQIKKSFFKEAQVTEDKSIVRPTFSYMGEYKIADSVICDIAEYEALKVCGVERVNSVIANKIPEGVEISVLITAEFGKNLPQIAANIQKKIKNSIDYHTSINVERVDVNIKKIKM